MKRYFYKISVSLFLAACFFATINTKAQNITVIAGDGYGNGSPLNGRWAGDGGPATLASFCGPWGLAIDDSNNIYVGDCYNNRIRKINGTTGIVTTIAGTGAGAPYSGAFSGDGGPATQAELYYPCGVAVDDSGNVYFGDLYNGRVRKITKATGIINTIAGTGFGAPLGGSYTGDNGPAVSAGLFQPYSVAVDDSFNVFIADTYNNVIRKVNKITGIITTVAGNGTQGYTGDGAAATSATMFHPYNLSLDDSDNLIINDSRNGVVRKVTKATGIINSLAGSGMHGYTGDGGPALLATTSSCLGSAVDHKGNLYFSDESNNVIRWVDKSTGIINTFAGTGYGAGTGGAVGDSTGDGGLAINARFWIPETVIFDKCKSNLYISDYFNNRIRKIPFNPTAITVTVTSDSICSGSSTTIIARGANSYSWSPGTALSSTIDSVVTANPTGSITYTVTGTSGCSTASASAVITVTTAPSLTISPASASICNGQNVTLSINGSGLSTINWGPSSSLNTSSADTVIASPTTTTTYTVTGNVAGCNTPPDSVVVTVTNAPPLVITPASASVCTGQSVTLSVNGGGSNISWSPGTYLNSSVGDTVISTPLTATTYTASTTVAGCISSQQVVVSIAGSAIAGTVTAQRDTICQGTRGNLSLSGNSSNIIQWQSSITQAGFSSINQATDTTYQTNPLLQSTYFRVVVGTGSCVDTSQYLELFVPPALTASFYTTQSGTTANFNSDSSVGNIVAYSWTFGDGTGSTLKNPSHTYTKLDSTYNACLTIYDGSNCSFTFCKNVTIATGIAEVSGLGTLQVYPNPVSQQLTVSSKQLTGCEIAITDVLGRTLMVNKAVSSLLTIDVSGLTAGVYLIEVRSQDGTVVQKFVKE